MRHHVIVAQLDFSFVIFVFAATLLILLMWMSVIDFASLRLPNYLNAALGITGLLWAVWSEEFVAGLIGAALGFGVSLLIRNLYFKIRGRQGLGLGDVKFLGAAGFWVGWEGLPLLLLIACISGLAFIVSKQAIMRDAKNGGHIAFGPHLSLALFLVWIVKVFELV